MAAYLLRYVHPTDDPGWEEHLGAHIEWLLARLADGTLLASGPIESDSSKEAVLVVAADSTEQVEAIARTDPYWQHGLVVDHTIERWDPIFGAFNAHSSRAGQLPPQA